MNHSLTKAVISERGFPEADLQLELELTQGLAELDTPALGPPRAHTPDIASGIVNSSPSPRRQTHPKLEVVEWRSTIPTKVKGETAICDVAEPSRKTENRVKLPPPSLATKDPPTHKPTISFKEKVTALVRSRGAPAIRPRLLPPRDSQVRTPSGPSAVEGAPAPNLSPHPQNQAARVSSRATSQLFVPKSFSRNIQNLRERQAEESQQKFHERYGGIVVEPAGRDHTNLVATCVSTRPSDTSKGPRPTKKSQAQKDAGKKRITKARAQEEEVAKICGSTKSYIVDMEAFRRRRAEPALPKAQHPLPTTHATSTGSPSVQTKVPVAPALAQQHPRTPTLVPSPASGQPPRPIPASLGSIPPGIKFTRKRKPTPEPREATEMVGGALQYNRENYGRRQPFTIGTRNGPFRGDIPKRRREDSERELGGPSPRKKRRP